MKISIIVPVYNVEKYIETCINSIKNQTYPNIEIILVNDGSKDSSGKICDEHANQDSRIKVIHTKNGGLSAARNQGIRNSTGDYLMFVDGDDFVTNNSVEDIVNIISKRKTVDIIIGKMIMYYDNNKKIEEDFEFNENIYHGNSGIDILTYMFEEIPVIMWSACRSIYRRDFLIENNFYFTEGFTSEDLDLIPKVLLQAKNIFPYNKPFYYYRQLRPNSIVNTVNAKRFYDIVSIIKSYLLLMKEKQYNSKFNNAFIKQLANIYVRYVVIIGYVPKNDRIKVINQMKEIQHILFHAKGLRGKYVVYCTKYFGFRVTSTLYKFIKEMNLFINRRRNLGVKNE